MMCKCCERNKPLYDKVKRLLSTAMNPHSEKCAINQEWKRGRPDCTCAYGDYASDAVASGGT